MTMRQRAIALWLACAVQALALAAPAAAQQASSQPADYIVAVVNSEPITNSEVRQRALRFAQQLQEQGQPVPPKAEFLKQVLERLISEKAQLQIARENGIKIDDALVDQAEQHIARSNQIPVTELRRRVQSEGMSPRQFREDLREQLMLQRLREREVESRGRVTEFEIDRFLAEQEAASKDPSSAELNLGHILIAVPENAGVGEVAQLQAKAQRVLERARAGEDFAKLGQEFKDGRDFGATGAPVGPRPMDRLPPLFIQAVQDVPEGGVSALVRSAAGFHIIKVYERRRGGLPGATVVQSHARHILLRPAPNLTETQAVQRLADFKRRVLAGQADFAQLAREFSQDASARNGGDLGWANPGLFVPEFEEAMNALAPGQIADPVISRFGVHLIQLLERRQAKLTDKEMRELARNVLREKKMDEAYATWAQDVRGRAFVDYREPPQ
jgi:peptidyl-prolyl cis-trans isomerase SurA